MSDISNQHNAAHIDRVWDLAKSIRMCMFNTWDGQQQHSRPMASRVFRDEHAIYFLDKADSAKENQIKQFPKVGLSYADTTANTYICIAGNAAVSNDRAKIKQLWSEFDKAWWSSSDDPTIRLITVTPDNAEFWDGPNRLVAATIMLTAAITGAKPSMGDNVKVAI